MPQRKGYWGRPEVLLPATFLLAILVGAGLLLLPGMTNEPLRPIQALFTSTSAVCVTGLTVVDTGKDFTFAGQAVIAGLIQAGGLGIMTFSILVLVLARRRLPLGHEAAFRKTYTMVEGWSVPKVLAAVFLATLLIEGIGFLCMLPDMGAWPALFHTISAFCNAGFALRSDSLASSSATDVITVMGLLILGGLGFTTLLEVGRCALPRARRTRRFSLHTRLVFTTTVLLLGIGTLLLVATEHGHWGHALFLSASARTAGFETTSVGKLRAASLLVLMLLMFVGASPGSTGGGIKTTTLSIMVLLSSAILKGKDQVQAFGREIPRALLRRSFAVFTSSLFVVLASILLLQIFEQAQDYRFVQLAFEAVSAFGTVGLSTGITPHLSDPSLGLLCVVMFVGRVGSLSFFLLLVREAGPSYVRYPEEPVLVG